MKHTASVTPATAACTLTPAFAQQQLALLGAVDGGAQRFVTLLRHGSLEVELYAPRGQDHQQPHRRDELYLIVSGSGRFDNGGQVQPFKAGDLIFVPAQRPHRFTQFTDDFATWVVFYGPDGGEHP
jgi:mannose-6-phosphate isomerase-like protein (cupin superfamily)